MRAINRWRKRVRLLLRRGDVERELNDELFFHLEMQTEANIRAGMTPEEAKRQAAIAFGATEKHREEVRDARWLGQFGSISPDAKLAMRMLGRNPALSVTAVLGMSVAIAIAAIFFTYMTSFYYSVPPFHEGERIVGIENGNIAGEDDWKATLFDLQVWRAELRTVDNVAAFRDVNRTLEVPGGASGYVEAAEITGSAFRVAGIPPLLGRAIQDADERPGAPPVVVIAHDEWERIFDADPAVVGREIRLGGVIHTVVGVMPEDFRFPVNHGYWTALQTGSSDFGPGEGPKIFVFGRLSPGVNVDGAQAELNAVGAVLSSEYPEVYEYLRPGVLPYIHPIIDVQQYPDWTMWLLQLLGGLLLAIIAVNVAVLVYARTAMRAADITVRTALGASRKRIVSQLFIEALALSGIAAVLGLVLAHIAYRQFWILADAEMVMPYWIPRGLTLTTIIYAAGLAILAASLVGAVPALRATGPHLQATLRQLGGGTGMKMGKTWTALVVAQVAIAVAVLPALVSIAWGSVTQLSADPTFSTGQLLTFHFVTNQAAEIPLAGSDEAAEAETAYASLQARLKERVAADPSVVGVTFAAAYPRGARTRRIEVEGAELTNDRSGLVRVASADVGYLDLLGVPLLAGRRLSSLDLGAVSSSIVVNRSFVQQVLGGGSAVGRRIRLAQNPASGEEPEEWMEIVGVVDDLYIPVSAAASEAELYLPLAMGADQLTFHARVRPGSPPAELGIRLREIATDMAPGRELRVIPLSDLYTGGGGETLLFMSFVVGLITLSVLLLSAAGISALMSFAVTRRQREVGIRTALGASRGKTVLAIFSRSTRQLSVGLGLGVLASGGVDRLTGGGLLGESPLMLLTLVSAMMIVAGLLATVGPARRALRIQPMDALRQE